MIIPPFLKAGDTVAIVATAGKVKQQDMEHARAIITAWGCKVLFGGRLFSEGHSYLAGTDAERKEDLQRAIDDPQVRAIICARGGYGTTRIIDGINWQNLIKNPKWIAGFSDITAIHLYCMKLGVESIHSTMPRLFTRDDMASSIESLRNILFGEKTPALVGEVNKSNRSGTATGKLIGGNLSLLVDSIGTSTDPDMRDNILVIEEVSEFYYKIDRMLMQLRRAGKLQELAGLVIGHITDALETDIPFNETIEQIVLSKVRDYYYPVAFGIPTGHEAPNIAWRHGHEMKLTVQNDMSLLEAM